jgi:hypothetical protein
MTMIRALIAKSEPVLSDRSTEKSVAKPEEPVTEKEKMKTLFAVLAASAIIFAAFVGTYADNRKVRIQSGSTPTPTPDTPTPSPEDTPTPTPTGTPTPTTTPTSASPNFITATRPVPIEFA